MAHRATAPESGTHFVVVPHTHWDREWYRPFEDFRFRLVALVDELLNVLETVPEYRCFHFDGQTIVLDDYLQIRPHQARRVRRLLAADRMRIGPWRVLPDEFLVSGESLIRNLQQGHEDCARYGVAPNPVGYTPDQFGHVGVLPQILAGFGLEAGVVWRGVGPDVRQTQFWWEAPDGTRLFAVYLPLGYSNGFQLPGAVEPMMARLEEIRREQRDFCTIPSLLVMNGSDHHRPQRRMPELLAEVVRRRPEWSFEVAPLAAFVAQARAAAGELDVHAGEFRHPWRANLLPGVTSVRSYQKQTDFQVCRLFEKYVEPLCAWADRLGDRSGTQDFIDYAWRLIIENHPHDSICGCSVDAVHDEMDTRWAKVLQVGTNLERHALGYLATRTATTGLGRSVEQALVTYAPARPTTQAIDCEVYLDDPEALASLRAADGTRHPVQVQAAPPELFFQAVLPADSLRTMVAGLQGREVQGYVLNNMLVRREGADLHLTLVCAHAPYGDIDVDARKQEVVDALSDDTLQDVHVVGRSAPKTRVRAVLPVGGQTALDAFAFSAQPPTRTPGGLTVTPRRIETDHLVVEAYENGELALLDKRTGRRWDRVLRLVDDGDRGDTYNFDPVVGGDVIDRPADVPAFSVVDAGPVVGTIALDMVYRVPAELAADRTARAAAFVDLPVRLEVSCYADLPRVECRVTVDNRAKDHRLRAAIALPFAPREAIVEGPFGVLRRPVELPTMPDTHEKFYGTAPTKGFVCVEDGAGGIALGARGIQEYEVEAADGRGTLSLTLLRSVGWLSRDDLEMRNHDLAGPMMQTPGAQSPRVQTFEFALMPYAGEYAAAGVPAEAHAYLYPPVGVRTGRHKGRLRPGTRLVDVADPQVVVSAATLTRDRKDLLVRAYNEGERPLETAVTFDGRVKDIEPIDLLERPRAGADETVDGATVRARFTPTRFRTWRVRRPRTRA